MTLRHTFHKAALASVLGTAALASGWTTSAGAVPSGDTERINGCAAHWRNTASWDECVNANITVQLETTCKRWFGGEYTMLSDWRTVRGTKNPVNSYECEAKANRARNNFQHLQKGGR